MSSLWRGAILAAGGGTEGCSTCVGAGAACTCCAGTGAETDATTCEDIGTDPIGIDAIGIDDADAMTCDVIGT